MQKHGSNNFIAHGQPKICEKRPIGKISLEIKIYLQRMHS